MLFVMAADGSRGPEQIGYLAVHADGSLSIEVEDGDPDAYFAASSLRAGGTVRIPVCLAPAALDLQALRRDLSPEQPFGHWLTIMFGHRHGRMGADGVTQRPDASEARVACANLALYLFDADRESQCARGVTERAPRYQACLELIEAELAEYERWLRAV
jgi:glyoxylase-like metal-dependent hydrolase (beta-lactamase superfamily II)